MPRGLSPVVGTVVLVALTVGLAAVVGVGVADMSADEPPPRVTFSASADAATDRIALTHDGGASLPLDGLAVEVRVDGDPLTHQPPVPFFAATGFQSGPTGPFNSATDGPWTAGETAAFRLAGTNDPLLEEGDSVTVDLYSDDDLVATLEAVA